MKNIIIVVNEDANIRAVAEDLLKLGLEVSSVLDTVYVITGSIEESSIDAVRTHKSVISVDFDRMNRVLKKS